jgi:hypothetical protein
MKLLDQAQLDRMIKKVFEVEAGLPEDYQPDDSPTGTAKITMYTMAHRIRDLEAELEKYRNQHGDLQGWVDKNINTTDGHA